MYVNIQRPYQKIETLGKKLFQAIDSLFRG